MRKHFRHLIILLALASTFLSGGTVLGQTQSKKTQPPKRAVVIRRTPAWEYKITESLSQEDLNKLGAEGWELVATFGTPDYLRLYFKRRKS